MALSKLFTPQVREKRGDSLDRSEEPDMFVNPPHHAEVPVFTGTTDKGDPHYPLRMAKTSQQFVKGASRRPFNSKTDKGIY